MVHHGLSHSGHHKTRNGWYSGMMALIYSIVGLYILYSKNVLGLSGSFYGGLVTASVNF